MSKCVWITGATGGIGAAIARRFARDGYAVLVQYRTNRDFAVKLVAELISMGADAACVEADVTDEKQMKQAFTFGVERFGHIDVLVHAAGIASIKLFTDTSYADWYSLLSHHLDGAFFATQAVLPDMVRRHEGQIVLVSSMWGQVGASCEVAYSTAKAGLIGMTKALAKEMGPSGVRVNCVAPGLIDTPMNASADAQALSVICEETPLGRMGTPEEVAACVAFLTSADAGFVTGQVLSPNGGLVMM